MKTAMSLQIPLHMLLLAGLLAPARAADDASSAAKPAAAAASAPERPVCPPAPAAYAGLNALPPTDEERAVLGAKLPEGVGLRVGVVDPEGPAVDQLQPGDVLVRFDDQLLVNFDQFRSLVQMRRPGDTVKFSVLRNGSAMTVPVRLAVRPPGVEANDRPRGKSATAADALKKDSAGARTIQVGPGFVINIGPGTAHFPPEIMQQLEELQARGLFAQPAAAAGARARKGAAQDVEEPGKARPGVSARSSRSFSFGIGTGLTSSSSTHLVDEAGSVTVEDKDGKRHATVKDAAGAVLFDGDISTEAQRAQLSEEVRRRLKAVEGAVLSKPAIPGAPSAAPAPAAPKSAEEPKKFDRKKGA